MVQEVVLVGASVIQGGRNDGCMWLRGWYDFGMGISYSWTLGLLSLIVPLSFFWPGPLVPSTQFGSAFSLGFSLDYLLAGGV